MVAQWCVDSLGDRFLAGRCVQCGELIDPVILNNRRLRVNGDRIQSGD